MPLGKIQQDAHDMDEISDAPADFDPVVWMAMALLSGLNRQTTTFWAVLERSAGDGVGTQGPKKSEWSMVKMKHWRWSNLFDQINFEVSENLYGSCWRYQFLNDRTWNIHFDNCEPKNRWFQISVCVGSMLNVFICLEKCVKKKYTKQPAIA